VCISVVRLPVGATCSTGTTMVCDGLTASCTGGVCVALPGNGEASKRAPETAARGSRARTGRARRCWAWAPLAR
jgi:hypothetical protein